MARRAATVLVAGAGLAYWVRERAQPLPCPYWARFLLAPPRPFLTRARLRAALGPRPGERVLEVGPGTGRYSLDVATRLEPGGRLDLVDVQQAMLDHTLDAAAQRGIANIAATRADATALPFADRSFDAAYLVTVLGEVPDQEAALQELHRVLKPGGRIVVGEIVVDPHWVRPHALAERAARAGLRVERRLGPAGAYFAVLRRAM